MTTCSHFVSALRAWVREDLWLGIATMRVPSLTDCNDTTPSPTTLASVCNTGNLGLILGLVTMRHLEHSEYPQTL